MKTKAKVNVTQSSAAPPIESSLANRLGAYHQVKERVLRRLLQLYVTFPSIDWEVSGILLFDHRGRVCTVGFRYEMELHCVRKYGHFLCQTVHRLRSDSITLRMYLRSAPPVHPFQRFCFPVRHRGWSPRLLARGGNRSADISEKKKEPVTGEALSIRGGGKPSKLTSAGKRGASEKITT